MIGNEGTIVAPAEVFAWAGISILLLDILYRSRKAATNELPVAVLSKSLCRYQKTAGPLGYENGQCRIDSTAHMQRVSWSRERNIHEHKAIRCRGLYLPSPRLSKHFKLPP
jgi:hypothetical protein